MYQMIGIDPSLAANTIPQFTPGTHGIDDDGKIYKYVQYSEEAAAVDGVAGEACYYTKLGYGNHDVTSDLSASDEIGAGILQVIMSDNEYAWIQIKGFATMSIALTGGVDGDPLTPTGATDGTLDVVGTSTANVGAIASDASAAEIICNFPY